MVHSLVGILSVVYIVCILLEVVPSPSHTQSAKPPETIIKSSRLRKDSCNSNRTLIMGVSHRWIWLGYGRRPGREGMGSRSRRHTAWTGSHSAPDPRRPVLVIFVPMFTSNTQTRPADLVDRATDVIRWRSKIQGARRTVCVRPGSHRTPFTGVAPS